LTFSLTVLKNTLFIYRKNNPPLFARQEKILFFFAAAGTTDVTISAGLVHIW
jgi:hypothetical protein